MRCFWKHRNSQRMNQNVQDDYSSSGRLLLDLVPKNFFLVWEKDRGVEVRRKEDIHATFSSSFPREWRKNGIPATEVGPGDQP